MYIPFGLNLKLDADCHLSSGAPAATLGVNEDYCVDIATGDLYRKHAGAWGSLGNIQGNPAGSGAVQKQSVTITHADLTDAVNGEAQAINIGAALPTNAVVLAHEDNLATVFSGGGATAVKLDVGGTDPDAIVAQQDVFTGAATGLLSPRTGAHAQGSFSAQQLTATFTPDVGHTLLALTAGSVTITVYFAVVP